MFRRFSLWLAASNIWGCAGASNPVNSTTDSGVVESGSEDAGPETVVVESELHTLLEPFVAKGLPGIAGAVFNRDRLLASGVAGVRKFGDPTAVAEGDRWHLGSDTKAMTATLVALYVDEGKLSFDDTLGKLFAGEKVDPTYLDVTLEALLQHRGGAPTNPDATLWASMAKDGSSMKARKDAVLAILALPTASKVGGFVYSNTGYMMVGAALERKFGSSWEVQITKKLFEPLEMPSCGFGAPATKGLVDQPWGHTVSAGTPRPVAPGPNADNPPALGPAGTVHCSLRDWGKFLQVHLKGARGESTIVSAASIKRLQSPPAGFDYACGWGVGTRPWAGGTVLQHTGSNTMFFATVWIAPAIDRIFVVATNRADEIAAGLVDESFGPMIRTYSK